MGRIGRNDDRYDFHELLGEGGSGRVWLVEDRSSRGSLLALKELTAAGAVDAHRVRILRREFATLASLRHPNLVEVYEFDTAGAGGAPRFSLEYIRGDDILATVAREGPALLMDLAAEALRALAFLHDFGLLHRDLKPANLMVRHRARLDSRLVILDFGLAQLREDAAPEALRARGTLPYMAPELFGGQAASPRSDLYALAAVLYEAVFHRPPIVLEDQDVNRFVQSVIEGKRARPDAPQGYAPGLSRWLDDLLAPEPEARPASAREALARLNEACDTKYPVETPTTRAARLLSGPPAEREETLAELWSCLDPSLGPLVVWISGPPGFGKTRLLRWLASEGVLKGRQVVVWQGDAPSLSLEDLVAMADERPTVLLIDDIDAADARTIELVDRVARDPHGPLLQVVAGILPGGVRHPVLRRLWRDTGTVPRLVRVELGRLDCKGIRAMASRAAGSRVSDERVEWLLQASEGVPALAESLLVEGVWEKGGQRRRARHAHPTLGGRSRMLSRDARRWLDALAVLRRNARDDLVAELAGLDATEAREAAHEVSAVGLAHRSAGLWNPESRHGVEQRLVSMQPARRCDLHSSAARLVEHTQGDGADPWLLSQLWSEAGETERGIEYAVRAAEYAQAAGDPAQATERYGRALRLLGRRRERRYRLRLEQGRTASEAGLHQAAVRAFGAAARFAESRGERIEALALRAEALVHASRFGLALEAAAHVERLTRDSNWNSQRARARKAAAIALGRLGREGEAVPLLEEAHQLTRGERDTRAEAEVLQLLATCKLRSGRLGAEEDFLRSVELYDQGDTGDGRRSTQELKARIGLAVIRARRGEYDAAAELLLQVRRIAAEQGQLNLQENVLSRLAMVALERGCLDEAVERAQQAADLATHLGDPNLVLVNQCRLADAEIRCGDPGEAIALMREVLERPLARVEPENVNYARMLLAEAWMDSGGGDETVIASLMEQTLADCRRLRKPRALLMALAFEMKRRARAECGEPLEAIGAQFDSALRGVGASVEPEIRIRAALARASYHLLQGDARAAAEVSEQAAKWAADHGSTGFEAQALALLADACGRLGQEDRAEQARTRGRARLEEAAARIRSARVRGAFEGRPDFAGLVRRDVLADRRHHSRLRALYDMIRVLNSETDAEALLQSILDMALKAVGAERGMILLKEQEGDPRAFAVHVARGVDSETAKDAESYSRNVVAEAGAGRSLLAVDAASDERFRDLKSVSLLQIRSLMCVPLRSRGKIIGTVYLDSRRDGALFTEEDLRFLEAFADHAALALENVLERARLERQNRRLQSAAETRTEFANIVGRSPGMQAVFDLIEKVAASDLPVLIHGDSGTGKELVARAIHFQGSRRRRPLVLENCSAVPASLLESELFGHVRGAFTGAERDHPGLFEQANQGTLFLDEIGDMSPEMQARLLRVLETGEIRRVGGEKPLSVDVRVVAATHRDLEQKVRGGEFREDLLYRLQVVTIEIPPLRERPGDVALLTEHFLLKIGGERGRAPVRVNDDVLALFEQYSWPGNVRQLENTLRRLTLLSGGRPISRPLIEADAKLRPALLPDAEAPEPVLSLKLAEREQLRRALDLAGGNRRKAAELLHISRATLYRKLKDHSLT